jgi:HD-GYP domain-containing protein (c-di-GMP phosphodiesterase class II)
VALKSRDIAHYMAVNLAELRPGEPITFDLHLYFPQNQHLMLWRKNGDVLTDGFIDKYQSRGVGKVFVHSDEAEAMYRYLHPSEAAPPEAEPAAAAPSPAEEPAHPDGGVTTPAFELIERRKTEEGTRINELRKAPDIDERKKTALIAKEARTLLSKTASAATAKSQVSANLRARQVVQDVLDDVRTEAESLVAEIWKLANVDPDLAHAVNVATYAVIFAMSFGRFDNELLADLALAALLHDVGLSQVPASLASVPWKQYTPQLQASYASHVRASVDLITEFAPEIPARVRAIIDQHHEKFDGSGYPNHVQGFRVDDVAQLLAIADLLDSMSTGQWDGIERTLKETFDTLERLERGRTFPEYFNPEVFSAVVRWIRNPAAVSSSKAAIQTVGRETRDLLKVAR